VNIKTLEAAPSNQQRNEDGQKMATEYKYVSGMWIPAEAADAIENGEDYEEMERGEDAEGMERGEDAENKQTQ
jgi:hypothetical protein